MNKKRRVIILLICLIVVVSGLFYFYPPRWTNNPMTSYLDNFSVTLNGEQLQSGGSFEVTNNLTARVSLENNDYTLRFNEEDTESQENINLFYDDTSISLGDGEPKEIDLNQDGSPDVVVLYNQSGEFGHKVYMRAISSEATNFNLFNADTSKTLAALESAAKRQSVVIFILLFIIFIILVVFLIKTLIAPAYKLKKLKARGDPVKMMRYLIGEMKESRDSKRATELSLRLKHFYNYLSKEDQIKVDSEISDIKRYIN